MKQGLKRVIAATGVAEDEVESVNIDMSRDGTMSIHLYYKPGVMNNVMDAIFSDGEPLAHVSGASDGSAKVCYCVIGANHE